MYSRKIQSIKLCYWNSASLGPKIGELRDFVLRHDPDVILVQETLLRSSTRVAIPNFYCYRDDKVLATPSYPFPRHGTAVFIRNSIPHHRIPDPGLKYIEATTICINDTNVSPLTIASVYVRNRQGSRSLPPPPTPTRLGRNSQSTIDLTLHKGFSFHCKIESIPDLSSDHNPVLCTFDIDLKMPEVGVYFTTNWERFQNYLLGISPDDFSHINTQDGLEEAVTRLTNGILLAHSKASKKGIKTNEIYTPTRIKILIKLKNKFRRDWQRFKCPTDKTIMNRIQAMIKKEFRSQIQDNWNNHLLSLDPLDGSLFKMTKRLKREDMSMPPLKRANETAYTDNIKTEFLADNYEAQFKENTTINVPFNDEIESTVKNAFLAPQLNNFDPVEPHEIISYIKKTKIKKAPGKEGITNKMGKNFPPNIISILTVIFNAMFTLCHFPKNWKVAVIVPIKNAGKEGSQPVSYRPISLLPMLSKIAEIVIKNRLLDFLETNQIMIPHQFGFTKKLSTTHQLLRVAEYISKGFTRKQCTAAIFLDVEKAFDRVWISGLVAKLIKINAPWHISKLIHSYLTNRSFTVQVKKTYSSVRPIHAGTPQGSVLGPLLFNIYMNDIPLNPMTKIALFADDTAILARAYTPNFARKHLQNHLNSIELWLQENQIKICKNYKTK